MMRVPDYRLAAESIWTRAAVEQRLRAAVITLHRLPRGFTGGRAGLGIDVVRDVRDAYGYSAPSHVRIMPLAREIDEADEACRWLLLLDDRRDRLLVWARANLIKWRKLESRFGACTRHLSRHYNRALLTIVARLNGALPPSKKSVADMSGL